MAAPMYIPISGAQQTPQQSLLTASDVSRSPRCKAESHYGRHLHFPYGQ